MNRGRVAPNSDILTDLREARTGLSGAPVQGKLIGKLVREVILVGHQLCVAACCLRQRNVPLERWQSLRSAFAVRGIEEKLFLFGWLRRSLGWPTTRRDEQQEDCVLQEFNGRPSAQ